METFSIDHLKKFGHKLEQTYIDMSLLKDSCEDKSIYYISRQLDYYKTFICNKCNTLISIYNYVDGVFAGAGFKLSNNDVYVYNDFYYNEMDPETFISNIEEDDLIDYPNYICKRLRSLY